MKERNLNLDLIRCIAVYLVCSIHFFYNSSFYSASLTGANAYFMVMLRTVSIMCIPLFQLLTGYLMCKKELSLSYYKGIVRILLTHGICMLMILAYRYFFQHEQLGLLTVIKSFVSNYGYSWYIGMYMGLFCLIPFLNLIYNSLDKRWKKRVLIFTMIALTALPSLGNYSFKIVPDSFVGMYPLTYYFIGAYIREYSHEWKKLWAIAWFCFLTFISSTANFIIADGNSFVWNALVDWGGLENTLVTPFLFIFLCKLNMNKIPAFVSKCIVKISNASLALYLLSWIFDKYAYPKLTSVVTVASEQWKYYIIMTFFVFICSLALAVVADTLCRLLLKASKIFS